MEPALSYRDANRARLRNTLVSAARELAVANGWDRVRMADVARAAGVSRQTVYNEFSTRGGLAEALAVREIDAFTAAVRARLHEHGGDVRAAGHAAILHTLREAAGNPLIKAILTGGPGDADELLPYLTTRSDLLLAAACAVIEEWAAATVPDTDPATTKLAGESIVRLTVSHIMLPTASPELTADALAEVFTRLMS
ncbi:putative transcriptional regulator, TetR family protein [Actinoplanes ianthinogenes]|uniref:Transcriptional regulator, TetR family protein n=1 Tax=Actinoplanes ianthinogenes TaxID=122358 RepID=A0ABN6CQ22_9ACTN|nr:TetR family transcriptional regulator [Actinoplanes ianthinogenes]BCJ47331.1 putative transcriptional regulator, TetR family protein [Actinoplanes ianthinogenes]GGR41975.1 putative transcriptional regulator, TetR family protein [Actinoplanes ianthinogenes]